MSRIPHSPGILISIVGGLLCFSGAVQSVPPESDSAEFFEKEVRPLLASAPTRSAVWQLVPDGALFAAGGRVDVNAVLAAVASFAPADERDVIRAGIEKAVSPHWMRHAHASHALDRGAPVHLVQATLGHASLSSTSRYLHSRPADSSSRYLGL